MRGEYMSHIVHLFYIWPDSTVEVGFDVRDMHARVGTSLMRSSSCSFKKKAWNTRKFRWWGVQCTYPNSIRTKYVIFTVNSLQILTPTHPPPLSLTFPRRFRSVKSERCSCKILSKDYNLKLCNYTTKRIRQKSVWRRRSKRPLPLVISKYTMKLPDKFMKFMKNLE